MNTWIAQTHHMSLSSGARLYVMERMWSPDLSRPPYAVGDKIGIANGNDPETPSTIVAVGAQQLAIELADGTQLQLRPTPSNYPPPSLVSPIPFEDWIVS